MTMAMRGSFQGSYSHCSLLEPRHAWNSNCNRLGPGARNCQTQPQKRLYTNCLSFKPHCLSASSRPSNTFPSDSEKPDKRFRANVLSPATSISTPLELLHGCEDEYDGVVIDPHSLPLSKNAFVAVLRASLSYWKLKGKKGIWLKILAEQADLVPVAIREGFGYHHAEPGYVTLVFWIPGGPCLLPACASHQVGVAGFVINDKAEVLVVKEKRCSCTCAGLWKLPTGFINKSEELFSGAVREVKEETGIDTAFVEVVAFRHAHLMTFENSDLLFICLLKPLTSEINIDEEEIEAAKWMPLAEFLDQPTYQEDCMSKKAIDMCVARYENRFQGLTPQHLVSKLDGRPTYLYCNDSQ